MVDDQFAPFDALGARQVHVVGYAMRGLLAANIALRERARIASATFIAGAFFEDSSETSRLLAPYVDSLRTEAALLAFFRYILPTWRDSLVTQGAQQYMADYAEYADITAMPCAIEAVRLAVRMGTRKGAR